MINETWFTEIQYSWLEVLRMSTNLFIYVHPSQGWRILKLKEQAVYIQQDIFEQWTVGFFVGKYIGIIPLFIPDEMAKHINPVAHRVSGYMNESRVNYNCNHSCLIYMNEKLCLWLQVHIDLTCFSEQLCKAAPVFITTVTTSHLSTVSSTMTVTRSTKELNWSEVLAS